MSKFNFKINNIYLELDNNILAYLNFKFLSIVVEAPKTLETLISCVSK